MSKKEEELRISLAFLTGREKEQLRERFNAANAQLEWTHDGKRVWVIAESCPLCTLFKECKWPTFSRPVSPPSCPFERFGRAGQVGCKVWLQRVLERPIPVALCLGGIYWGAEVKDDSVAREWLAKLRKQASELIEWE
jgi:hypothetical protein